MKKATKFFCLFVLIICSACNSVHEHVLFDGKHLNNLTLTNSQSEDGILVLKGNDSKAVYNQRIFKDFELLAELCTTPGGKGEIWFHSDPELNTGYNIAINNDRTDSVWWKMTGSLMAVRNLTNTRIDDNQWFNMKIRVEGKSIQVFINEELMVDYIEPAAPYRTELQMNKLISEGVLGFTGYGNGNILPELLN